MGYAHDLTDQLGDMSVARLSVVWGLTEAQADAFIQLVTLAHDITHVLNRSIIGLRDILACETINPIYTTFVHKAFCTSGVDGLRTIFATMLAISIFSMIMIMFRAALYPIKEPEPKAQRPLGSGASPSTDENENNVETAAVY